MFKILQLKKGFFQFTLSCVAAFIFLTGLNAQEKKIKDHDFLMPKKGKSMIVFNSGIPYVAIGEYSYGITNRFAAGILIGHTTILPGYGIRLKAVIAQPSQDMRILLKSPIIYYPFTRDLGGEPWLLAWPTLTLEWKLKNGARVWTGIGMVGAACTDYLFGSEEAEEESQTGMKKEVDMAKLWSTIQIGYSKPLSNRLSIMAEVAPVFNGLELANPHNWIVGPPVLLTFGLSYAF